MRISDWSSDVRSSDLSKRDVAEGTTAFFFSRPADFAFKPGQAIDLILPDAKNPDADGERHAFSLVGAPFQDELCITTRMRDTVYKRQLKGLSPGATVKVDGPFGSLTLHSNTRSEERRVGKECVRT